MFAIIGGLLPVDIYFIVSKVQFSDDWYGYRSVSCRMFISLLESRWDVSQVFRRSHHTSQGRARSEISEACGSTIRVGRGEQQLPQDPDHTAIIATLQALLNDIGGELGVRQGEGEGEVRLNCMQLSERHSVGVRFIPHGSALLLSLSPIQRRT